MRITIKKLLLTAALFAAMGMAACASPKEEKPQETPKEEKAYALSFDYESLALSSYALSEEYLTSQKVNAVATLDGVETQEILLEWSVLDESVATVDEEGEIFAVAEGETSVKAEWILDGETVAEATCQVEVIVPIVETDKEIKVYMARTDAEEISFPETTFSDLSLLGANPLIFDGTEEMKKSVRAVKQNGKYVLYRNDLTSGVRKFLIGSKNTVYYQFTANVVGKIVRTANDLMNLKNYGTVSKKGFWNDEDLQVKYVFDGYFELGNNIDLSALEKTISTDFFYDRKISEEGEDPADFGFVGVFDGCGYTVKGGVYGKAGLFGSIGRKGVIKNVAFTEVTLDNHDLKSYDTSYVGCVLARTVYGTVKDVLIDVTKVLRTYQWGLACGFAKDILGEARFENCVGYYPQENQDGYESYSQYALENSVAVNCYSISGGWYQEGVSEGYTWLKIVSKSFVEGMTAKPFGTTVAEVGFVGLDDTMWDLSGEKAVFKSSLDF